MFNGKKIKKLEEQVMALESEVKSLDARLRETNLLVATIIDDVLTIKAKAQKPKYRPKKKNGKEDNKAAE